LILSRFVCVGVRSRCHGVDISISSRDPLYVEEIHRNLGYPSHHQRLHYPHPAQNPSEAHAQDPKASDAPLAPPSRLLQTCAGRTWTEEELSLCTQTAQHYTRPIGQDQHSSPFYIVTWPAPSIEARGTCLQVSTREISGE
jgi:hypothetical protein